MMKVLGNNLVVVQGEKQSERKGILLPDTAQEENCRGEVIAIGPGVQTIDVGDSVLIPLTTYARIMRMKAFDFAVTINGEEKPAVVIPEDEIAVVWPKGE